jgi:circadian clock protein KaiC
MPGEKHLVLHLHELLSYASAKAVAVLMMISQHGVLGGVMPQPIDASYLADTVFLFRYYEFQGELRKAISVFKRRGGMHEPSIRELNLGPPHGVNVGEKLHNFQGVFSGMPTYHGEPKGA